MRAFILSFFTFEVSIALYQILNAKKDCKPYGLQPYSYIPSKPYTRNSTSSYLSPSWLCPRPISISQLHVLPHFHL